MKILPSCWAQALYNSVIGLYVHKPNVCAMIVVHMSAGHSQENCEIPDYLPPTFQLADVAIQFAQNGFPTSF